jgi:hypothetical protein
LELEDFTSLVATVTGRIKDSRLDAALEQQLNQTIAPGSAEYERIFSACRSAIDAGWMCAREAGGIKFGRVIKPGARSNGFSVDVVDMANVVGPHHSHPNGEIDLIMPLTADAKFDGRGAGWCVYPPGTAHCPTVTDGRALVLYLLPEGRIEFSAR